MHPLHVVCVKCILRLRVTVLQHKHWVSFVVLCKLLFNVKITNKTAANI